MISLKRILFETGEGTSKPFPWKSVSNFSSYFNGLKKSSKETYGTAKIFTYEVKGDKGNYTIKFGSFIKKRRSMILILPGSKPKTKPKEKYDLIVYVGFHLTGKKNDDFTNFNEQYRLMASIIECVVDFIKNVHDDIFVEQIVIEPKSDVGGDVSLDSKRGRFYLVYVQKNISKLPGRWTAIKQGTNITIKNGDWKGNDVISKS